MKGTALVVGMIVAAALAVGCAGSQHQQMAVAEADYTAPMSIYSVMDSTSLVYSDPAAASPFNDSPIRWLGFLLHPIGQALDYGINRPIYSLANRAPYLFGYTTEDSMLDSQRR